MPSRGLASFDIATAMAKDAGNCGTYTVKGDRVTVSYGPTKIGYSFTKTELGLKLAQPSRSRRVPPADGTKLSGTYRIVPEYEGLV